VKTKACPECDGAGVVDKDTDHERQCPNCGGTGIVPDDDDGDGNVLNTRGCDVEMMAGDGGPAPA